MKAAALRKIFGEQADQQRYIATVPGYGYRFVAAVTEQPAERDLVVAKRSLTRTVIEDELTITDDAGSGPGAEQSPSGSAEK